MSKVGDVRSGRLAEALLTNNFGGFGLAPAYAYASSILAEPQAHIDALVEAGVLEQVDTSWFRHYYALVQPHKHEWVIGTVGLPEDDDPVNFRRLVVQRCKDEDCPAERTIHVDARALRIEVPE